MSEGSYPATAYAVWKTLSTSAATLLDAFTGRLTTEQADQRIRRWARGLLSTAEVRLSVDGLERIPRDTACILMSNHQSHFDIPIIYSLFPGSLRMVAKAELFRVPVWGPAMQKAGFVPVARSGDRSQAILAMSHVAETLQRGVSVWLAPEGTRSPDGRLGRFKKGGFLLAQQTGIPIWPMVIDGSKQILPKNTKLVHSGVEVKVWFGSPIHAQGRELDGLMQEVRTLFEEHLQG